MATGTQSRSSTESITGGDNRTRGQTCSTNVGMEERHVTLALGGALAALGLFRLRPLSLLIGSGLIYRGMTGHCSMYQALGIDTNDQ